MLEIKGYAEVKLPSKNKAVELLEKVLESDGIDTIARKQLERVYKYFVEKKSSAKPKTPYDFAKLFTTQKQRHQNDIEYSVMETEEAYFGTDTFKHIEITKHRKDEQKFCKKLFGASEEDCKDMSQLNAHHSMRNMRKNVEDGMLLSDFNSTLTLSSFRDKNEKLEKAYKIIRRNKFIVGVNKKFVDTFLNALTPEEKNRVWVQFKHSSSPVVFLLEDWKGDFDVKVTVMPVVLVDEKI